MITGKFSDYSDGELEDHIKEIQAEQRRRRIAWLLSRECWCDRYTCGRCQELSGLHYDPKKDTGGKAV